MHNTSCGLIKHLFDVTEKKLHASGQYNIVKERFKQVPSYMDLHLPAKRLVAKNITATQRHSLGACMPVCLLGLEDMEPYCHAFTGARTLCRHCFGNVATCMATRHCLWHAQLTGWVDGDSACLPSSSREWPSLLTDGQPVHADANFRPERHSACPQCASITYGPPVICVAALMEWSDLRDMRQHTEHTIAAVQDARVRYATASHDECKACHVQRRLWWLGSLVLHQRC